MEGLMHGLYLLWWVQEKQLSPAIVAAVLAAGELVIVALELPTGWFADRFGHRASLIAGSVLQVTGMLWCWLGAGVSGLTIASVLVAAGDAFRSGADQALLYRTCAALDREEAFQSIEARTAAAQGVALVILVLAGGAIVSVWGFAAGWIAEVLLCGAGLAIACAMAEPPAMARPAEAGASSTRAPGFPKALLLLILPVTLLGAAAEAASFLAQTAGGSTPARMTLLVAAIALAEAAGSGIASRVPAAGARGQLVLGCAGVLVFAGGIAHPLALSWAAMLLAFLLGLALPLRGAAIQRLASDDMRARAASLASACDKALTTIALPAAGVARGR